jgi:hypothetical protein
MMDAILAACLCPLPDRSHGAQGRSIFVLRLKLIRPDELQPHSRFGGPADAGGR